MIITENTNLNGALEVSFNDGSTKTVVVINSNLVESNSSFNFNFSVMDKDSLTANLVELQTQMDEFMVALKAKMLERGYLLTI